jgi:serine-type D-Ala-D-Ala carboxypeptidase/endopeptidase
MRKALKITAWIIGIIVTIIIGFFLFILYRANCIKNIKDTNDLEVKINERCDSFLRKHHSAGLAVGIIKNGRVYMQGFGFADLESKRLVDSSTIFEIGSISKVFTAEIAEILSQRKVINWNDNILNYFPQNVKPKIDDHTTMLNLVTHTSGYPRLPETWFPILDKDTCNPYKSLKIEDLFSYLIDPKEKIKPDNNNCEYSNLGNGILGHIMEWKTGKSYEDLLQTEICNKLKLNNTSIKMIDMSMLATGYDMEGKKTCHWDFPILYSAGAIKSNTIDMVKFMQANLNQSELNSIFLATQKAQYSKGIMQGKIAKGWQIDNFIGPISDLGNIVWHNGGTGGFSTYIGMLPEYNCGVIVMSNQSFEGEIDLLGFKLLTLTKCISFKK